jgi:hypothetical protein
MRDSILLSFLLLLGSATASKLDPVLLPFDQPLLEEQYYIDNTTASPDFELKLLKRQSNGCKSGYANCATLGAPGLCCKTTDVCAQDSGGNVACCPTQASCTGTIRPVSTGSTTTTAGGSGGSTSIAVVGGAGAATTDSTAAGGSVATIGSSGTTTGIVFVGASGTTGGTQQTSGGSRSYVNNPYYPYAFIPTTYANAAA